MWLCSSNPPCKCWNKISFAHGVPLDGSCRTSKSSQGRGVCSQKVFLAADLHGTGHRCDSAILVQNIWARMLGCSGSHSRCMLGQPQPAANKLQVKRSQQLSLNISTNMHPLFYRVLHIWILCFLAAKSFHSDGLSDNGHVQWTAWHTPSTVQLCQHQNCFNVNWGVAYLIYFVQSAASLLDKNSCFGDDATTCLQICEMDLPYTWSLWAIHSCAATNMPDIDLNMVNICCHG